MMCDMRVYEYTMIIYYRRYDLPMCICIPNYFVGEFIFLCYLYYYIML